MRRDELQNLLAKNSLNRDKLSDAWSALAGLFIRKRKTISGTTLAARVIARSELLRQLIAPWIHIETLRRQAIAAFNVALGVP
jgi:hypothetical protein